MSTTSDQELSECSNSSASYTTLESSHSSPLQQVPQLTTSLTGLSCSNKNLYKSNNGNSPYLRITEQPQNHFRFRYDTEKSGSTHGSILGKSYVDNITKKKTHPTVELVNYTSKAVIRCSIKYRKDINIHKNISKILEDEQTTKSYTVPKSKSYKVGFPGIGVHTIKKKDLSDLLYNRLSELSRNISVNTTELREHCDSLSKRIDQNIVWLKFSAHDVETGKEICDAVFSDPIHNKKSSATNELKIYRMSMCSARPSGGDDLFLLVDRIDKNDIKVRFYEEDENGKEVWSAWSVFLPSDVHFQCAIVCRTPRYTEPETSVDVKVWIELVRPSNGTKSNPKEFKYMADPVHKQYKRRKIATPCSTRSSGTNFSDTSLNVDLPVIVLPNDPNQFSIQSEAPQPALQPTSDNEWNIISSTLDILENDAAQELELQKTPSPMWGQCNLTGQPHGGIAASQAVPNLFEFRSHAPRAVPVTSDTGIAAQSAQPVSTELTSTSDVVTEEDMSQFLENALTEYAGVFDMCLDDLFQPDMAGNLFVGDSGRAKVAPSKSSTQPDNAEGSATDVNDVLRYQSGPAEFLLAPGARGESNDTASQGAGESLATGANESEGAGATGADDLLFQGAKSTDSEEAKERVLLPKRAVERAALITSNSLKETSDKVKDAVFLLSTGTSVDEGKRTDEGASAGTSKSADAMSGIDYPALFTPADAAEIKKLVRELCETIRDKNSAKSDSVRTKLERLFDIRLSNGDTFLHMTLIKSQRSLEALVKMVDSVKMSHLLNYGNNRGETVLHLAVIHSTPELVSLLVSRGCDPAARNCDDETAVHYAVRYAGAATLRALLDAAERAGAPLDLDAVSAERQSALHLCALHGRASCAALLGARGASGGVRDAAGRTPLHLCAYDVRVDVARALLPHAAPHVHATDGGGRTPLAVACARVPSPPALDLVRALLAAGARAEHAWRAARDHPAATDLLRPHMPAHLLELDEDENAESNEEDNSEPDDDEYESADDEYIDDRTPESLTRKLGQMGLSDGDAKSSASHVK